MNSIQNRILMAVLLAVAVPLTIIFLVSQTVLQSSFLSIEKSNLDGVSEEISRNVSLMMEGISSDLQALSTNPLLQIGQVDEETIVKEMKRQVLNYPRFEDISLYGLNSLLVHSTDEKLEPTYRDYSPVVARVLEGETVIQKPGFKPGAPEKGLFVKVYLPLRNELGTVTGFIKARVAFDHVAKYIAGVEIGSAGQAVLLDEWGNLIAHRSIALLLTKFDDDPHVGKWLERSSYIYTNRAGQKMMYSAVSLEAKRTRVGSNWTLLCQKPMAEIEIPIRRAQSILIAVFVLAALLAFTISNYLAKKISYPLVAAGEVAKLVAAGDLNAFIDTKQGPKEIRRLAGSFNTMVGELRDHRVELERQVQDRTSSLLQSQDALSETMAQLHAAFDSSREAILLVGADDAVVATNDKFCELFGFDEKLLRLEHVAALQLRMSLRCVDPDQFREAWTQALVDDSLIVELEYEINNPEPRTLALYSAPVRADGGTVSGRLWSWRDLTEQRTLEQSLRQSQKMEAVGQLAGGVAHDFNNLLTGIVGNLALVEMELDGPEHSRARQHIEMAVKAGSRAAELIKQLLGFSRRSHLKLRAAQANNVIKDVRDLLTASIDPKVKIALEVDDSAWPVMVDPNQLEQVVMNLCVNAKDALGASGGDIVMRSENVTIGKVARSMHADAKPGDYLRVTVEDNGSGMPEEVQAKIFEPFFTTKEQGKGTGLGLATSFGIIKQLGGWILCTSEMGIGTRFDIFLPRSTVEFKEEQEVAPGPLQHSSSNVSETLLLVDDEMVVRRVAEALLSKLGYNILVAADGEEALRIYKEKGDEIDLVMLDLTMPTLSGKDTFRRLREEFDYVPVLICSGYLVDLTAFEAETGARPDGFVQKPYKMETMAKTVREVINDAREAAA